MIRNICNNILRISYKMKRTLQYTFFKDNTLTIKKKENKIINKNSQTHVFNDIKLKYYI